STQLVKKFFILFLILGMIDAVIWTCLQGWLALKIILTLAVVFSLICTIYFCYTRKLFAVDGGNIQNKVLDLLVSQIDWDGKGKALDIGCGSGALTIKLAKKYDEASITGIDYWGGAWGYFQRQCKENASIERVIDKTEFLQASASKLPFSDDTFDLIVSNLTFHEVKDSKNKLDAVKEAIRVVKKGGRFVFQDLFLIERYYGTPDELIAAVKAMGASEVHFIDTSKSAFIPNSLKLPFMIGTMGLLYGEKQ
ncbi:MAG: putative methyltransferase, partial [Neobacillus sp.]|nr:putative methyltransferase [Neobacillus sp.]